LHFKNTNQTFRRDGQSFWDPSKPLEMTPKGLEMTAKGFGKRWSPSVRGENSEFGRVAPQGAPKKLRPDPV
jgi:hypothetical protein